MFDVNAKTKMFIKGDVWMVEWTCFCLKVAFIFFMVTFLRHGGAHYVQGN